MKRGFVYLCAILDWASRRVLAWQLSNTLTTDFCVDAVQEALTRYGPPEIFNTDQGCQFTSEEFTGLLKDHDIQISMDGIGRWRDNVFVERLWRSLKYEEVYLHAYETVFDAQQGVGRYLRGGSADSDSMVNGSLASRKPPGGGEPKERGDEENERESRSNIQGAGGFGGAVKGDKTLAELAEQFTMHLTQITE